MMKQLGRYLSASTVLLIALIVYWSYSNQMPSEDFRRAQHATDFSADNALEHVKEIAKEAHYVGTKAHKEAQRYIIRQLQELGLAPEIQSARVFRSPGSWGVTTQVENIVARIKGRREGKALLLLSHYDSAIPFALGASDDASGVATILEGLRAFLAGGKQPENDLIILITDAEELGLLGAKAFLNHHPWAEEVGLALNFEARGSGGPSYILMETNGQNGKLLSELMKANPSYPNANSLMYSVYKLLPNDTDLTPFREIGDINGYNFAFIGDHFDYHTAQDNVVRLDRASLVHQGDYLMTLLQHFAFADISDLSSEQDYIYVNFPFIKLISYPFSWNMPLFMVAVLLFVLLLVVGVRRRQLQFAGIGTSFLPFLFSLIVTAGISFGLWYLLTLINPAYNDILQGFTYNGYSYIIAFTFLNLTILLAVYHRYSQKWSAANLMIAPLFFWLIINLVILVQLKGAAFLIIPVYMGLVTLAVLLFVKVNLSYQVGICLLLAIPALYIVSPFLKVFPVGLGMPALFIAAIFLVLLFGLIIPLFHFLSIRKMLIYGSLIASLVFFALALSQNGFNEQRKKPNNIVFLYDAESDESYWATINHSLDSFLDQFLGENPARGGLPSTFGIRPRRVTYHQKTENRQVRLSEIMMEKDTIVGDDRLISFSIVPQREVSGYGLITNDSIAFKAFSVNGTVMKDEHDGKGPIVRKSNRWVIRYVMSNADERLTISFKVAKESTVNLSLQETSYDLLSNDQFEIAPRTTSMMPFPFVDGDAIITRQKVDLTLPSNPVNSEAQSEL